MMTHEETLSRLDGFVDGTLAPAEARGVEEHLAVCPECARRLEDLRLLLARSSALSARPFQPLRDLWPEVRRRISETPGPAGARPRSWYGLSLSPAWRTVLATGAVALVVLAAAVFVRNGGVDRTQMARKASEKPAAGARGSLPADSSFAAAETELRWARAGFDDVLKARGSELPQTSREAFEQNLKVLDEALRDSRAALESDPQNQGLQKSLITIYQKQLELMRWASHLLNQT